MLEGRLVTLSAVEKKDLKQLLGWRNNPYFRKHFREFRELSMAFQEKWFQEKVMNDNSTLMFAIRSKRGKKLLGCCGLVYISWVYRHADLSLYIGWKNSYIDRAGYGREACAILLDYAFNQLGLNKAWTEIYTFDHKKKRLYGQLGFKVDGVLRDNYFYEGKFWDSYIMSILAREWRRG
jgi:RimJ/RimL family protein N-acetyltransferase